MKTKGQNTFGKISEYGIKPVKSLGQNFLTDNNSVEKIIKAAGITKKDLVIEIGPGTGNLTEKIAELAGNLIAVEIDQRLIPLLQDVLQNKENTQIINADILKLDIEKDLLSGYGSYDSYKLIANLPYYITTPIIMKFLKSSRPPEQMTVMLQKEVADRLRAGPGGKEYGSLSIAAGYYCDVSKVMDVSPNCFYPKPEVSSTVLNLRIKGKNKIYTGNEKLFFNIVKSAFAQRRKKISNSIANTSGTGVTRDDVEKALVDMGLASDIRGEKLSIEEFAMLTIRLMEFIK